MTDESNVRRLTPEAEAKLRAAAPITAAGAEQQPLTITVPDADDPELKIIGTCIELLKRLQPREQARVLEYLRHRFER